VLYSPSQKIAFAHYPKTAGGSVSTWFRATFPDAVEICHSDAHISVRAALSYLTRGRSLPLRRRLSLKSSRLVTPGVGILKPSEAKNIRIFGVVRSPFDMVVSLFRWWRRPEHHSATYSPLRRAAEDDNFRQFVECAVIRRHLPRYEDFFDVGGFAWNNTNLLHFDELEGGLELLMSAYRIKAAVRLEHRNRATPDRTSYTAYERQAGSLVPKVHDYFSWYYRNQSSFVRGTDETSADSTATEVAPARQASSGGHATTRSGIAESGVKIGAKSIDGYSDSRSSSAA
jgi:hypothetical protein